MSETLNVEEGSGWEQQFILPSMHWLPQWVKDEYLDFLWETLGPEGGFRDDADIEAPERLKFYESILGNLSSAPIWTALEQHRWLVSANFAQGLFEWSDQPPEVNQVGDLLQAAHMAYRGFTPLEAMKRSERDALGESIAASAKKLAAGLERVWAASSPVERGYPFACPMPHESLQSLLERIADGASSWIEREPVLHRPGKGDAARRYFIVSMAEWFEEIYSAQMEDGTRQGKRLDNVTTALVNCLYPDGVIDQSTVLKVIRGAKHGKAVS